MNVKRYLILGLSILFLFTTSSFAESSNDSAEEEIFFDIPIYASDKEAIKSIQNNIENIDSENQKSITIIDAYGILQRTSANSQSVNVRLCVSTKDYTSNGIRFNSLTVQDTSVLNPKIYGSFNATSGGYLVYNFANSNLGIASIGTVKIPTSVEKAKIKAKNCDIFIIEKGAWISAAGFGQAVNIH